jgi:hypothetical protein
MLIRCQIGCDINLKEKLNSTKKKDWKKVAPVHAIITNWKPIVLLSWDALLELVID